ncbi:hypothetical protein M0638_27080, partial [Roseomonas sp. NAR14]|nr:hypothetical protein [Roseomonas acroporae]
YYALRNHLLDFLVERPAGRPADPRHPPVRRIGDAPATARAAGIAAGTSAGTSAGAGPLAACA